VLLHLGSSVCDNTFLDTATLRIHTQHIAAVWVHSSIAVKHASPSCLENADNRVDAYYLAALLRTLIPAGMGLVIARDGVQAIANSLKPDFAGGCPCCA
jgi:hypothetical protein